MDNFQGNSNEPQNDNVTMNGGTDFGMNDFQNDDNTTAQNPEQGSAGQGDFQNYNYQSSYGASMDLDKQKKKADKKQKVSKVFTCLILTLIAAFLLVSSIMDLAGKGEQYEGDVVGVEEFFTLKHTVNFIPTGVGHYYYGYDITTGEVVIFRAAKNFMNDKSYDEVIHISGKVERLKGDAPSKIAKYQVGDIKFKYGTTKYVNAQNKTYAIYSIMLVVVLLALAILGYVLMTKGVMQRIKAIGGIYFITVIGVIVFAVHVITMR